MNDYGGTLNDMRLSNIKTATQGSTGSIFYLNSCMDTINIQAAVTDSRDAQTQPEGQHTLHDDSSQEDGSVESDDELLKVMRVC